MTTRNRARDAPDYSPDGAGGFPGFGDDAPLELPADLAEAALTRLLDGTHDAFADTLAGVGNCVRPIRLSGSTMTIDRATGEVLSSWSSDQAPLGALYRPCGTGAPRSARPAPVSMPATRSR